MITELGKELRKIRIDRNERLLEMAKALDKSTSFISAVEIGKKSPPSGFEDLVIRAYQLVGAAAQRLRTAADRSRKSFSIEPQSDLGRDTAALFARRVDALSAEDFQSIQEILMKNMGEQ